jgi:uncharacterized membrane protein YhaH (DUF805 family)
MKKVIISAALIFLLQTATPYWWWVMAVPLVVAFATRVSTLGGFRLGLISAGTVWTLASLVLFLTQSQIIAMRMAAMMNFGNGWVLVLVTGVIAMLTGGVAGATGAALRSSLRSRGDSHTTLSSAAE